MKYRTLVGYIPFPVNAVSFATPVYKNVAGTYEYHKIDDKLSVIIGFDEIGDEPMHMVELPEALKRVNVEEGDSPFFVITNITLLFVGTSAELKPRLEEIKKMAGKYFTEELELIPMK